MTASSDSAIAGDPDVHHPRTDRPEGAFDAAVLDVGSNSVRLVIYRVEGRAIWTLFNEKLLAGLGRDGGKSGRLSPAGVQSALAALRRFRAVLDAVRPAAVHTAATAAVRDAVDGSDFIARVHRETGFDLRMLSGEEEAHLSALGVISGIPRAHGVAGDLGGSSLELIRLEHGRPGRGITLPLGPFALGLGKGFDAGAVHKEAAKRLARIDGFNAETFYAVGGAWRSLALLHMRMADYPLEILQQYELGAAEALEACRFAARLSRSSLERIEGLSKKRVESLPFAAVVLECLIERLDIQRVCISAYGLREGLVLNAMPPELRARDPLIEGCAALGVRQEIAEDLGHALQQWLEPALAALPPVFTSGRDAVLTAAACRLADLGSRLHPDHRADLVFEQVLRAPIAGMSHPERAFIALALFARHTASANLPEPRIMHRLLGSERQQRARALGAAMRLGCDLSGRSPILLAKAELAIDADSVRLTAQPDAADLLLGELTARRAGVLAALLERPLKLSIGEARAAE